MESGLSSPTRPQPEALPFGAVASPCVGSEPAGSWHHLGFPGGGGCGAGDGFRRALHCEQNYTAYPTRNDLIRSLP